MSLESAGSDVRIIDTTNIRKNALVQVAGGYYPSKSVKDAMIEAFMEFVNSPEFDKRTYELAGNFELRFDYSVTTAMPTPYENG